MQSICILTDNTVQFPQPAFTGREFIRVINFGIQLNGTTHFEDSIIRTNNLPQYASPNNHPLLIAPTVDTFYQTFLGLANLKKNIVVILTSSYLTQAVENAQKAADALQGKTNIHIIDSQTTSIGLGILVQLAADLAYQEISSGEIEKLVRLRVPQMYTLLCPMSLSYLHYAGFLDYAQAVVGEMSGIYPIFGLEEGRLNPLEKAKNPHSVVEYFIEFIDEFDHIQNVAYLQSSPSFNSDTRSLRQHVEEFYENTLFSEHSICLPLATLMGPKTVGLVVLEGRNSRR